MILCYQAPVHSVCDVGGVQTECGCIVMWRWSTLTRKQYAEMWKSSWVAGLGWFSSWIKLGFPGSLVGKESACSAGDPCSILGLGRSPGEGNGNPLKYSCLESPIDRETWWAIVHGISRVGQDLTTKPHHHQRPRSGFRGRIQVLQGLGRVAKWKYGELLKWGKETHLRNKQTCTVGDFCARLKSELDELQKKIFVIPH